MSETMTEAQERETTATILNAYGEFAQAFGAIRERQGITGDDLSGYRFLAEQAK